MEVLAPAGNLEKLKYALAYGADAVYAAGKMFGLRAKADNLTHAELREAVEICRMQGKKIFVPVNIYAGNEDLNELISFIQFLAEIAVDAVIVADPAVFMLVKEHGPSLAIHISTQANVTSWMSAKFWQDMGASRVILARELGKKEILEIKNKVPGLELEMFVHGAMCMSWSGRCLLSAFLNKRHANKGECSQPCRWDYAVVEKTRPDEVFDVEEDSYGTYFMNSKDLCLVEYLDEIAAIGVDSIKIEGRMKSLYYAANVARIYVHARTHLHDDNIKQSCREELEKVSHRVYSNGFFEEFSSDEMQYYESSAYIRNYQFIGTVITSDASHALIDIKAKFTIGDELELIFPRLADDFKITVAEILDEERLNIDFTKPNTQIYLKTGCKLPPYGIIRKKL